MWPGIYNIALWSEKYYSIDWFIVRFHKQKDFPADNIEHFEVIQNSGPVELLIYYLCHI